MSRLKLHRKSECIQFVEACKKVISKAPKGLGTLDEQFIDECLADGRYRKIYRELAGNSTLWQDRYSILLPRDVHETFVYYRTLCATELEAALTKKFRSDK